MEQFHLHHLLQELGSKLSCPQCKKKIPVQNLKIKSSQGNTCSFDAKCKECGNVVNINAVVETHAVGAKKEDNSISETTISNITTEINYDDVVQMNKLLKSVRSFKEVF